MISHLHYVRLMAIVLAGLVFGCRHLPPDQRFHRPEEPLRFFHALDQAVARAGVKNASAAPVPGFPYLRANRFLEFVKFRLTGEKAVSKWIDAMQTLDLNARTKEIAALPSWEVIQLTGNSDIDARQQLLVEVRSCSEMLRNHDQRVPGFHPALMDAVSVPGEYRTCMRAIGAYPLFAGPVMLATHHVRQKFIGWHRAEPETLPTLGAWTVFTPSVPSPETTAAPAPPPSSGPNHDFRPLFERYAPILVQDLAEDYDQWGQVEWEKNSLAIRGNRPALYAYETWHLFDGRPAVQLNYVLWYPARRGPNSPVIERGHLDGLTFRISLDAEGRPVMADLMNNCGCYHFFIPSSRRIEKTLPDLFGLEPFAPVSLPLSFPQKRLVLHINSGWHQVVSVGDTPPDSHTNPYSLLSYDLLETLPRPDGRIESMFDEKGIAKGTGRIEPLIFFAMGIPDVGSMRQRGHHAIRLAGSAHFDDPMLIEKNFTLLPDPGPAR